MGGKESEREREWEGERKGERARERENPFGEYSYISTLACLDRSTANANRYWHGPD